MLSQSHTVPNARLFYVQSTKENCRNWYAGRQAEKSVLRLLHVYAPCPCKAFLGGGGRGQLLCNHLVLVAVSCRCCLLSLYFTKQALHPGALLCYICSIIRHSKIAVHLALQAVTKAVMKPLYRYTVVTPRRLHYKLCCGVYGSGLR
jgi:hypothetical protein